MADLPSAHNVFVCRSAPHNQLLPEAAKVVTHAGHGTVIRSLAAGVPAPVYAYGTGSERQRGASRRARGWFAFESQVKPKSIRNGVLDILESPRYGEKA